MGRGRIIVKALVTGGGGFLGGAIVSALLSRGDSVKAIQRGIYPELSAIGCDAIQGDLTDQDAIINAAKDCDVIFHVAAKAGVWGDYDEYYQANVLATKNVIEACKQNNISRLIYTSTPSVVFDGTDEEGIDESVPYAKRFFNAYQKTKAEAEELILKKNSPELKTVALRPHLIWGPGDNHLAPRVISRAKAGRLRLVGDKENKVDSCYIDNAVQAHLLVADELAKNACSAGKAYFISNDEPMGMSDLINKILAAADLPPVKKKINASVAYAIGTTLEYVYSLLRIKKEPLMTRFVARQLSTAHWFDLGAAKKDFQYQAVVNIDEGMERLKKSFVDESIK